MTKKKPRKKGMQAFGLEAVIGVAVVLLIAGFVLTISADTQTDFQADFTAGSVAYNVSQETLDATVDLAEKQSLLVTIGIMAIVVSVLLGVWAAFQIRGGQ